MIKEWEQEVASYQPNSLVPPSGHLSNYMGRQKKLSVRRAEKHFTFTIPWYAGERGLAILAGLRLFASIFIYFGLQF